MSIKTYWLTAIILAVSLVSGCEVMTWESDSHNDTEFNTYTNNVAGGTNYTENAGVY